MIVETEITRVDWDAYKGFLRRSAKYINSRPWEPWLAWGFAIAGILITGWIVHSLGLLVYSMATMNAEHLASLWRDYRGLFLFPVLASLLYALHILPLARNWLPYFRWNSDNPAFARTEVEIRDDGISVHADNSNASFAWSAFVAGFELKHHFILMLDRTAAIVLPKRCLADEAEIEAVRDRLDRQLGGLTRA